MPDDVCFAADAVPFPLLGARCFCAAVSILGFDVERGSVTGNVLTPWVLPRHLLGGTDRSQCGAVWGSLSWVLCSVPCISWGSPLWPVGTGAVPGPSCAPRTTPTNPIGWFSSPPVLGCAQWRARGLLSRVDTQGCLLVWLSSLVPGALPSVLFWGAELCPLAVGQPVPSPEPLPLALVCLGCLSDAYYHARGAQARAAVLCSSHSRGSLARRVQPAWSLWVMASAGCFLLL